MKIKVGVNGYGTIGKRVAWAVMKQPDMELVGVVKRKPNWEVLSAVKKGIPIYTLEESIRDFERRGIDTEGTLDELLSKVDVIVDSTPGGIGKTYKEVYRKAGVRAIFQGGEKSDIAEVSFNSFVNYREALRKQFVRVVSCNTTGLVRIIHSLSEAGTIRKIRGVIVRRGADPKEIKKGPIDALILNPPKPPSHHAIDVKTVMGELDIITYAVVAPTTLAHLHYLLVEFKEPKNREEILKHISNNSRVVMVNGDLLKSTVEVRELAKDMGRPNGDIYENVVWEDSIWVNNKEVMLAYAVHQEAIVVPENIDAIRAVTGVIEDPEESIKITNNTLGIKGWI